MSAENLDLIAGWVSFVLTLFILSYLLGDNVLYRLAVHVLTGAAAGYASIVAVESVILPWMRLTIFADGSETDPTFRALGIIPFLLGTTLLLKLAPQVARVGNVGLAYVVGVGTSIAIVGAVSGTIVPLVKNTSESYETLDAIRATVIVVGTISTLIYFQYLAKRYPDGHVSRPLPLRLFATLGKMTVAITLGAIYGGLILTSLSVLSAVLADQISFLMNRIG